MVNLFLFCLITLLMQQIPQFLIEIEKIIISKIATPLSFPLLTMGYLQNLFIGV